MKQYLDLLNKIITEGKHRDDRTGTGTIGIFGHTMRFDMNEGFPLITTKKLHLRSIIHELIWFLQGSTNIKYLNDNNVTIWDEWADENGELGPVYGYQWRKWNKYEIIPAHAGNTDWVPDEIKVTHIDQIASLVHKLKNKPDDRRMLVSAWNVAEIDEMALPTCHYGFQVYTIRMSVDERLRIIENKAPGQNPGYELGRSDEYYHSFCDNHNIPDRKISLLWNQRSVDTFLGLPFNIASYGLLLLMLAQVANMVPDELVCSLGDTHLYVNHLEQAKLQLSREPKKLPIMKLNPNIKNIDDFKYEDFQLEGYDPHPHIKADVSI